MAIRQPGPKINPTRDGISERTIARDRMVPLARILARQAATEFLAKPASTISGRSLNTERRDVQTDD